MRILIVESDHRVARILLKGLQADHFAVDLASNGREGLQLAVEVDYHIILLDWEIP
jgi:two-component system copper resistance phosphate regulon response regulator CusR